MLPWFEYSICLLGPGLPAELDTKHLFKQRFDKYYLDLWFLYKYFCEFIFMVTHQDCEEEGIQDVKSLRDPRPGHLGMISVGGISLNRPFPGRDFATYQTFLLARALPFDELKPAARWHSGGLV